jgi:hypothetical protein
LKVKHKPLEKTVMEVRAAPGYVSLAKRALKAGSAVHPGFHEKVSLAFPLIYISGTV